MVLTVLHVGGVEAETAAALLNVAQIVAEGAVAMEDLHPGPEVKSGAFLLHRRFQRNRVNGVVEKIGLAVADALLCLLNEILHRFGHFGFRQGMLLFGRFFLFARNPYKGEA